MARKIRRLSRTIVDRAGVSDTMARTIAVTMGTGTTPTPPPDEDPVWSADWESGVYGDYMDASLTYNWQYSSAQQPVVSTLKKHAGSYSCKFPLPANTERSEAEPLAASSFAEGDDYWFSFWVLWDGVPIVDKWANVGVQWQTTAYTSPPIQLQCRNGLIKYGGGWGHPAGTQYNDAITLGNLVLNTWQHFVFHIKFSSDPTVGRSDIWWNGAQVANAYYSPGGTMYPGYSSYVKYGYYHDNTIDVASAVWLDDMAVGASAASVGGTG